MEKFMGKYRITSARAAWWDYAAAGYYFITICTAHRECLFGQIHPLSTDIIISPIGEIVQEEWQKSFIIRSELFCDAFILMPNHLHAIIRIDPPVETHGSASNNGTSNGSASNNGTSNGSASLPPNPGIAYRPPRSISSFVAGFKSAATKRINEYRNLPEAPVWQSRFYDHIIRNATEYQRIKLYIENNPQQWQQDKFFTP